MASKDVLVSSIDNVLKNVALYPAPSGDSPESMPLGWEEFFAKYPSYVQYQYASAVRIAEGARNILENQPLHKQKVAGAILRIFFSNEEIEEYGREEIPTG